MAQGEGSPAGPQAGSGEGTHLNDGSSKEKGVKAIFPCHFLRKPTAPLKQPENLLSSYPTPPLSWAGHESKHCGKAKLLPA